MTDDGKFVYSYTRGGSNRAEALKESPPRKPTHASNDSPTSRKGVEGPKLEPVALHSARHTFASILIAAGVNAKALTVYVGHASINTTMDVYGT